MYQFEYLLSENDYYEFSKFHAFNSQSGKRNLLVLRLIIPIFFSVYILLFLISKDNSNAVLVEGIVGILFSVIGVFISKFIVIRSIKAQIRRMRKDGKLPYGVSSSLQVNEEFLIDESDGIETKIKYANIEKVALGDYAIYVYFNAIQAIVLPFSVFQSQEEKEERIK